MADNFLITGYWGEPHITPENDRGINAATFGKGRFVLPVGEEFRAEYIGNNTIRMYDGKLIDNGAAAGIPAGEYVDLLIPETSQGMKRNDLIVFQYQKDGSTLIENGRFVVLQGEETSGTATDPEITQQDLLSNEATFDQMALYRVSVTGAEISTPICIFSIKGFGYGEVSRLTTNLNEEKSNGWYFFGDSALNRPQHIQYGCMLIVNRSGSEVEQVQLAFSPLDGTRAQRTYRNSSGGWSAWEYENPPMSPGVEYRTTEKFDGKSVYVKLLVTNTLPSKGTWVGIDLGNFAASIIECKGRLRVKNGNVTHAFPYYRLVVNGIGYAVLVGEGNYIQIYSTADLSSFGEAEILVKYTKLSD